MKRGKYTNEFSLNDLHEGNISLSRFMEIITKHNFKVTSDIDNKLLYTDTVSFLAQTSHPKLEFGKKHQVSTEEQNDEIQLEKDTSNSIFESKIIVAVIELIKKEGMEKYLHIEKMKKAKKLLERYLRAKRNDRHDQMIYEELNYLRQLEEMRREAFNAYRDELAGKINFYHNQINMINAKIDDLLHQKNKIFEKFGVKLSGELDMLKDSAGNQFFKDLSEEEKNTFSIEAAKQIYEIERTFDKKRESILQAKSDIHEQLKGLKKEQAVQNTFSSEVVTLSYNAKRSSTLPLSEKTKLDSELIKFEAQWTAIASEERKLKVDTIQSLAQKNALAADEVTCGIVVEAIESSKAYSEMKVNAYHVDAELDITYQHKEQVLQLLEDTISKEKQSSMEYVPNLDDELALMSMLENELEFIEEERKSLPEVSDKHKKILSN